MQLLCQSQSCCSFYYEKLTLEEHITWDEKKVKKKIMVTRAGGTLGIQGYMSLGFSYISAIEKKKLIIPLKKQNLQML